MVLDFGGSEIMSMVIREIYYDYSEGEYGENGLRYCGYGVMKEICLLGN